MIATASARHPLVPLPRPDCTAAPFRTTGRSC